MNLIDKLIYPVHQPKPPQRPATHWHATYSGKLVFHACICPLDPDSNTFVRALDRLPQDSSVAYRDAEGNLHTGPLVTTGDPEGV